VGTIQIKPIIIVGSGAAGIMAAIRAKKHYDKVIILEQNNELGKKLKATGGGKCNLTNTLDDESFIKSFGKNGKFIRDVIYQFNSQDLRDFFQSIGVQTHCPDGFRVFPHTHSSSTIINALKNYLDRLNIPILYNTIVKDIKTENNNIKYITTNQGDIECSYLILATGGLGYQTLGATGKGHILAQKLGHKITSVYPAMMPLFTKEKWVANCTADTIPKVTIYVDIKKYKKLTATGDLIFTKKGIRGPVVLDFAREITPLFDKYDSIPIIVQLLNKTEDEIIQIFKQLSQKNPHNTILDHLKTLLPLSLSNEFLELLEINPTLTYKNIKGSKKDQLIKLLAKTPLTIIGHDGFKQAMITRGGVSLKDIDPKTMKSKIINNLSFCGELIDIDGPCGGYNLQWAFSSGYVAGLWNLDFTGNFFTS